MLLPTLCGYANILLQWNPDFFQPPRETKIRWKNRRVEEIGNKITVLVRVIGSFEKMRTREIGFLFFLLENSAT